MKNLKKILSLIFMFLFTYVLAGCDLTGSTYIALQPKATSYSAWENYDTIDKGYYNFILDLKKVNETDKSLPEYDALCSTLDNRGRISSLLRNCLVAIDSFESKSNFTVFDFPNFQNFQIVKFDSKNYDISYKEYFKYNIISNPNPEVDALIFNNPISFVTNAKNITKNDLGFYTIEINDAPIEEEPGQFLSGVTELDYSRIVEGNTIQTTRTFTQDSTRTIITAKQTIKNSVGTELESYERIADFRLSANVRTLTSTVTRKIGGSTINYPIKTYRLNQNIKDITLLYDKEKGYLSWDFSYSITGQGQFNCFGESYNLGTKKHLVKEYVRILTPTFTPYNFNSSFTYEFSIDGSYFYFKLLTGEREYVNIIDQDISKFAKYNNEPIATCFIPSSGNPSISVYK